MYIDLSPDCAARVTAGGVLVTVSTVSASGVPDVMSCAWNCPFDRDQVLIVLDLGHTTTQNIKDTGKFVIGVPSRDQVDLVLKAGDAHGRDIGDKFKAMNLPHEPSARLGIQTLSGMMAYVECELEQREVFLSTGICVGRAVSVRVRQDLWNSATDSFESGIVQSLHHVAETVFVSGGQFFDGRQG